MVRTGLPPEELGPVLRHVVLRYDCALDVRDDGSIVYRFDPRLRLREPEGRARWARIRRRAWAAFRAAFKVIIAVVLIGYVVLFVVLMIAAFVALTAARSQSNSDSRDLPSFGGDRQHGGGGGGFWFWYFVFGRDRRSRHMGSPRYGRWANDASARGKVEDGRPFYRKIYAFVFGPEEDEVDPLFTERGLLAWIRESRGVVTPTQLAARTGWSLDTAEKESTRLLAAYGGDVEVTPAGEILYLFPTVLESAEGKGAERARPAPPIWERWEREQPVTGNTTGANVVIAALNAFVFFGAFFLVPEFIAPVLGFDLSDPAVLLGLLALPGLYSLTFFLVPLLRWLGAVRPENRRRAERNVRRGVLRHVYSYSTGKAAPIVVQDALPLIEQKIPQAAHLPAKPGKGLDRALERGLDAVALEYEAEPLLVADDRQAWLFGRIAAEDAAATEARRVDRARTAGAGLGEAGEAFDQPLALDRLSRPASAHDTARERGRPAADEADVLAREIERAAQDGSSGWRN